MEWKEMLSGKTLSREKLLAYGFHEREGRLWLERGLSHGFTAVFCADTDVLSAGRGAQRTRQLRQRGA